MDDTRTYLTNKLDPILEPIVTQILIEKPSDPVDLIISCLEKLQKKNEPKEPEKKKEVAEEKV